MGICAAVLCHLMPQRGQNLWGRTHSEGLSQGCALAGTEAPLEHPLPWFCPSGIPTAMDGEASKPHAAQDEEGEFDTDGFGREGCTQG